MAPDASSRGRGEVLQDFWRGRHARRQRAFVGPRVLDEVLDERPRAPPVDVEVLLGRHLRRRDAGARETEQPRVVNWTFHPM